MQSIAVVRSHAEHGTEVGSARPAAVVDGVALVAGRPAALVEDAFAGLRVAALRSEEGPPFLDRAPRPRRVPAERALGIVAQLQPADEIFEHFARFLIL